MSRCAILVLVLALPAPAFALREIMVGNQPLGPGSGLDEKTLAAVNLEERVVLSEGGLGGTFDVYFKGGPKALNEAFRRFAAIPADRHEIILMPFPAKPFEFGKQSIPYDWMLHIPGDRAAAGQNHRPGLVTLTVYIPNPNPPPAADPKAARTWIADLASDDFKVRERAAQVLAALGPSAAGLFREALRGKPSAEARDRLEKLLADVSRDLRADTLEIPAGLEVVGPDDLLARARKKLADKAEHVRGDGAMQLAQCGVPAEEVLPELAKILKTEPESNAVYGVAWGAYRLGAGAKPLLPALRVVANTKNAYAAKACQQVIEAIEAAKPEPVSEAEAKRRATIRKEIRELVAERSKAGK
jgi:hypothetical protein